LAGPAASRDKGQLLSAIEPKSAKLTGQFGLMPERQIIFVLGMGRSGTSAITRVLSLCGARLPEPLLGASESNPTGHWEPLDAININNAFLRRYAASWYDPTLRLQGDIAFSAQEKEAYIGQIRAFIERSHLGSLLVIKEPRITALAGFWFEAAHQASMSAKVVIPIRHPDQVAASLGARDGISAELSNVLWLKYNFLAERSCRKQPRVFVEYRNLLSDWRRELCRIAEQLAVDLSDADEAAIDGFLDRGLHRQRSDGKPSDIFGQTWTSDTYMALSAAARDEPLNLQKLDSTFSAFVACERTFRRALEEFHQRDLDPFL
jgi:hypothetical protein